MRTVTETRERERSLAHVAGKRPRVSVIIIFLDEAAFLQEAIDSVLAQTLADWELLLVDDGSTDGSTDIAKRYAAQSLVSVRYLEHPGHANRGMSASRNLGLAHAQGEFVLFLDGDDVILPSTLDDQVTFMDAHPEVGTVYGPMQWWYSWDQLSEGRTRDFVANLHVPSDRVIHPPDVLTTFLLHEDATPSGNLLRTELVRRLGGFEEQFAGMYEDQVFRVKLCLTSAAYVSSRVWYKYRRHRGSSCMVAVARGEAPAARRRFLSWVEAYCGRAEVRDGRVWRAVRRAIRYHRYPRLAAWETRCEREYRRWSNEAEEALRNLLRPMVAPLLRRWVRGRVS